MGKYKWLFLLMLICTLCSCKKTEFDSEIKVEEVFVEFVTSNEVDINYKLSQLGYEETGVTYYKKDNPSATVTVMAIRQNNRLKLSLQSLEANTEYVFKVFYKVDKEQKTDTKEYTVKTLSTELAKFKLEVKSSTIIYDDQGNFTVDIEGEKLNNLNLSELEIKVNLSPVTLSYPVHIADDRYKITIKGVVNPINKNNAISGYYQGKEIFFQSVPFVFDGERYWLTYQATSLRGYKTSVLNNEIYYFLDGKVYKWNDAEQRMVNTGNIPAETIYNNSGGVLFDGQLFFQVMEKISPPLGTDLSDYYKYPEGYSYNPATGKWTVFTFKENQFKNNRFIRNSICFVHKGDLYLVFSLVDETDANSKLPINANHFIYRYNKTTLQFETAGSLNTEIINFLFISVNEQLYLTGHVPVYDQGFKVSATLAIFNVAANFDLKEIYRGGTVAQPLVFTPKDVTVYDQKILIIGAQNDFILFDPADQKSYQVHFKNNIANMYMSSFFYYDNKLHLHGNLNFNSSMIYEISIAKGR